MPNHCFNNLSITGPQKDLRAFMKKAKGPNGLIDFNKFIPYPKKFKEMDEFAQKMRERCDKLCKKEKNEKMRERIRAKFGNIRDGYNMGGYDWCCHNWSTKWNAYEITEWNISKGVITITFDTAWGTPYNVFIVISKQFPTLKLINEYEVEGNGGGTERFYQGLELYRPISAVRS